MKQKSTENAEKVGKLAGNKSAFFQPESPTTESSQPVLDTGFSTVY